MPLSSFGEKSALVSRETASYMSSLMGPRAPVVEVPEARHHVMLDQPLGFIAALRMLLNSWMRNESAQQGDQGFESFSLRYSKEHYLYYTTTYTIPLYLNPQIHPRQFCRCGWTSIEDLGRSRTLHAAQAGTHYPRFPARAIVLSRPRSGRTKDHPRCRLRVRSPEPLPKLDAVAVGVADLRP